MDENIQKNAFPFDDKIRQIFTIQKFFCDFFNELTNLYQYWIDDEYLSVSEKK